MSKWIDDMQKELNKNKIEYPQDFIDKCFMIFPNDEVIKTLLDDKSFLLGEELQKRSRSEQKGAQELFLNFIDLYDEQYLSKGYFIKNGLVEYSDGILLDYKIREGEVKVEKINIDPVARRKFEEAVYFRLEQNETRRRKGLKIAKRNCGR